MDFALVYVVKKGVFQFLDFWRHWYLDGSRAFRVHAVSFFSNVEQSFSFRLTIHHFFEPLYKDYTILGRILGVIFRSGMLLFGSLFCAVVAILFLITYAAWLLMPVTVLLYAIIEFFSPGYTTMHVFEKMGF